MFGNKAKREELERERQKEFVAKALQRRESAVKIILICLAESLRVLPPEDDNCESRMGIKARGVHFDPKFHNMSIDELLKAQGKCAVSIDSLPYRVLTGEEGGKGPFMLDLVDVPGLAVNTGPLVKEYMHAYHQIPRLLEMHTLDATHVWFSPKIEEIHAYISDINY